MKRSYELVQRILTSTIPIVFLTGTDPVSLGLVTSFNHPGGNATGVTFMSALLEAKRLGLLHELLPRATMIAALVDPTYPTSTGQVKDLNDAAGALGQQIHVLQVSNESQLDRAFATFANLRPDALMLASSGFLGARNNQIINRDSFGHRWRRVRTCPLKHALLGAALRAKAP
jgi:putative tryptophan/tyrosine transport system substrate-binding protein